MGIGIAIAAIATAISVAADIAFAVESNKRQSKLNSEITKANDAIQKTKTFHDTVFIIVKNSIEGLQENLKTLPKDAIDGLDMELKLNLAEPDAAIRYVAFSLGGAAVLTGTISFISSQLVKAGKIGLKSILANVGKVAGKAGTVLAVVGLGFSLYAGITQLKELDNAIADVKSQRQQAENTLAEMHSSLNDLLRSMNLPEGNYDRLVQLSSDWTALASNFKQYSSSFHFAILGFAMGKTKAEVQTFLSDINAKSLKDTVIDLAKIIQNEIFDLMRQGKDEAYITNYFAKDHPREGLRFQIDRYVLSKLRLEYFS